MSIDAARLKQERQQWRKDHPHGFYARPDKNADGTANMMRWVCAVPGKDGTDWAGGVYPVVIEFSDDYPAKSPRCSLPQGFFHPNVYPSGSICLSILDEEKDWRPTIVVKELLLGVQELLATPNNGDPAQTPAFDMLQRSRSDYRKRVKLQAAQYKPKE